MRSTHMKTTITTGLALLFCGMLLFAIPRAGSAEEPGDFTNLKVLPKDISKGELSETMKSFTQALGVRCVFCHVGEEGQPLSEFDFASDEKEHKRNARAMLRMVDAINNQHLAGLESDSDEKPLVKCETCHRGHEEPETIGDALEDAYEKGGASAAASRYRELRESYYGGAGYDFREDALSRFAAQLAEQSMNDDALQMLTLNAEFNPQSSRIYMLKGLVYTRMNEKDSAMTNLSKALEIDPENQRAKAQLERLQSE